MKKRVIICDSCGNEIDGGGGVLRFNYDDVRKGAKAADLCGSCAEALPGQSANRRGRPRKS